MAFSLSVHQIVDAVLVFLFNWIGNIFAINEFSYVGKRKKYLRSNFWHRYSKIWNCCITYLMAYLIFDIVKRSLLKFEIHQFNSFVTQTSGHISYLGIGISTLILFRRRRSLRKVLNMFGRLQRMHCQFFGKVVNIPLRTLATLFLLNCISMYYHSNQFLQDPIIFLSHCRTFALYYLVDVSMILHLKLIRSLASYMESNKSCSKEERAFSIDFLSKLVYLRQNIQTINWTIYLNRLVLEILCTTIKWKNLYFVEKDERFQHIALLIGRVYASNMINVLYMAKSINRLERKIFDVLYERELFETVKHPETVQNLRLIKLEQLVFKAISIEEKSIYIVNCLYVRCALILEIIDCIATNAFLMISFSLTYPTPE